MRSLSCASPTRLRASLSNRSLIATSLITGITAVMNNDFDVDIGVDTGDEDGFATATRNPAASWNTNVDNNSGDTPAASDSFAEDAKSQPVDSAWDAAIPGSSAGDSAVAENQSSSHGERSYGGRSGRPWKPYDTVPSTDLFVGGLNQNLSEDRFREAFEKFGKVNRMRIMREPDSNQSRGFGFIGYADVSLSKIVMEKMQGFDLDGSILQCVLYSEAASLSLILTTIQNQICEKKYSNYTRRRKFWWQRTRCWPPVPDRAYYSR
ncbi:uncharacterized protein V1518DRAFT_86075 [Limtongia smithiae]|uniref:uncharacterized protein n=1 Tax=Limtongia smithiae TaxID=1125753 RepID=UPI0034CD29D9